MSGEETKDEGKGNRGHKEITERYERITEGYEGITEGYEWIPEGYDWITWVIRCLNARSFFTLLLIGQTV